MNKLNLQFKIIFILGVFFVSFGIYSFVFASELKLEIGEGTIGQNQQFEARVILNTQNKIINAIGGEIHFSKDFVELKEIRSGNSIISFWVEEPFYNDDAIKFSGIIPGGYNGRDGLVLSIIFEAKKMGGLEISLQNTQILLNDGRGTEDEVISEKLALQIEETGTISIPEFLITNCQKTSHRFLDEMITLWTVNGLCLL